jgi:glycosyltransferase involved in cell wall biosynthesis
MNIWIVSAYDPLPVIDADMRLLRYGSLAEAFMRSGHQIRFWTSTFAHWCKCQRFTTDTSMRLKDGLEAEFLFAAAYARNVSWARIKHNRQLGVSFLRKADLLPKPDLIVAEIPCLELAESAAHYARKHGIPFVCDIQDIWPDVYLTVLPGTLRPIGRLLLASEYSRLRRIIAAANAITAVSKQYLNWAHQHSLRLPGACDRVFPLGYRLPAAETQRQAAEKAPEFLRRHRLAPGKTFVTFLGQFASSYDLETVVAAAARLGSGGAHSNVQFVMAGAGDKSGKIQSAAAAQGNITLTGWLDYIDTVALLSHSHVGLAAYSRRAAQSLPYKPFEYMAFGLPLISSLEGELRDIIAQNRIGSFYRAGSAESLADSVIALAENPTERAAAGARARSLFEREFDADKIYSEMADLLATVGHNRQKSCPHLDWR